MPINLPKKINNTEEGSVNDDLTKETGSKEDSSFEKEKNKDSLPFMEKINNFLYRFSRVPLKEKLFFVQYLAIMLKSGISLSAGLETLSKQTPNKFFSKVIKDVEQKVEKGMSLTESLSSHKKVFGELFISMIEAGEVSGKLEDILSQLYIQLKKQHELISKVRSALTYPAVIVFAMGGIGVFMMVVVVPKLTGMLKEFDAELPVITKILIAVSDAIVNNGIFASVAFIIFVISIIQILRTYRGKYYFQAILLKFPIISPIVKKINLARFSRIISSLLKTDIMIIKTFEITASVLGNLHYRKAVNDMSERIKKGSQINEVINIYPSLFPPVVCQIVSVGEETGELDNMLSELADFYEGEVNEIMESLPSIIEPLLILVLGSGIGVMAAAIVMPMYSLTSNM
ncbi:MAG: type II secretion system F family protein [Patescibacteria group bacterium]